MKGKPNGTPAIKQVRNEICPLGSEIALRDHSLRSRMTAQGDKTKNPAWFSLHGNGAERTKVSFCDREGLHFTKIGFSESILSADNCKNGLEKRQSVV